MNLKSYIPYSHKYQQLRLSELVFIELMANFFIYISVEAPREIDGEDADFHRTSKQ